LSGYKIVQKIHLEGDGGWDYLNADDATGMLYVSHGKMVNVVDIKTGKSVATITDVNGVHGIAIAPEFNKGFISMHLLFKRIQCSIWIFGILDA
jgi:hypothetical protein